MAVKVTTIGRQLLNEVLPAELRDDERVFTGEEQRKLSDYLARNYQDKYPSILEHWNKVSSEAQAGVGGVSGHILHLKEPQSAKEYKDALRFKLKTIYKNPDLSDKERDEAVVALLSEASPQLASRVWDSLDAQQNPYSTTVRAGMKGKKHTLAPVISSPLMFTQANGSAIPVPILHGYAHGLTPSEYWVSSYGTRKGYADSKLLIGKAGYLSKQLVQAAHRAAIIADDEEDEERRLDETRGLPVDVDDADNVGTLLARSVGGLPKNTVLTPRTLKQLKKQGVEEIVIRSPLVGGHESGGVYARDIGIREHGRLPMRGEYPGVVAAQALSEPLNQSALSSAHTAGIAANNAGGIGGYKAINQIVQSPKESPYWASHADIDGVVQKIVNLPQGGQGIYIGDQLHVVPMGHDVTVKAGDSVEAGDQLSTGLPNPAKIIEHKGIGEGRRTYMKLLHKTMKDGGISANRRNVELVSRGLVNQVELTDEVDEIGLPGDTLPYNMLEKYWQPWEGAKEAAVGTMPNWYLEKPVLHYTVGTRIVPSMVKELKKFGLENVVAHPEAPPFKPVYVRGAAVAQQDLDWGTSMMGSGLKGRLLEAVHRGQSSNPQGGSYVPAVIFDRNFGTPQSKSILKPAVDEEDDGEDYLDIWDDFGD